MPDTDADTDVTAAASGRPAAEAVRELNHRTHPANSYFGPEYPADVYDVLGALHVGTQRLPQPVGQLGQFPEREAEAGRVAAPPASSPGTCRRRRRPRGSGWTGPPPWPGSSPRRCATPSSPSADSPTPARRRHGPRVSLSAADAAAADPPPPTSATSATAETFAAWLDTRRVSARTRATPSAPAGSWAGSTPARLPW